MKLFCGVIFLTIVYSAAAQTDSAYKNGLKLVKTETAYRESIRNKPAARMVDLKTMIPGVEFDLRYCSTNNFLHKKIYPTLYTTYLRNSAAAALAAIQDELKQKGLGLKIFDAYRPYSITKKIWTLVKDKRYAASPSKGSNHNRGAAVDLTIIDLQSKVALNMGTDFDCFSDSAHHDFTSLPEEVLKNRLLLKSIMMKHGFEVFETEWWHYTLANAEEYDLMDLSFEQLKKLTTD